MHADRLHLHQPAKDLQVFAEFFVGGIDKILVGEFSSFLFKAARNGIDGFVVVEDSIIHRYLNKFYIMNLILTTKPLHLLKVANAFSI